MSNQKHTNISKIVILNGEVAGEMAAAALARQFAHAALEITVIDLPTQNKPHIFGSTFPSLVNFHRMLGLDERDFLKATKATFKLSTRHTNLSTQSFHHAYGPTGTSFNGHAFHFHFLSEICAGRAETNDYFEYCLAAKASANGKFAKPPISSQSPFQNFTYAYHLDLKDYANFLRQSFQDSRINRIEGKLISADRDPQNRHITAIHLDNDRIIESDFIIDCSGTNSFISEYANNAKISHKNEEPYCDKILTARFENKKSVAPYTQIDALSAGWQWRIPLAGFTDCGYAYSSRYQSDESAVAEFINSQNQIGALPEQNILLHVQQKPYEQLPWNKNCVALGSAAGTIESYEGMALHHIQSSLARLISLIPARKDKMDVEATEYNRLTGEEFARIQDYMNAFYLLAPKNNLPYWESQKEKPVSTELARKMRQFKSRGRLVLFDHDPFLEESWLSVFFGHGFIPDRTSPLLSATSNTLTPSPLLKIKETVTAVANTMPMHRDYLEKYLITPSRTRPKTVITTQ